MSEEIKNDIPTKPNSTIKRPVSASSIKPKVGMVNTSNVGNRKGADEDKKKKKRFFIWFFTAVVLAGFVGAGVYLITRIPRTEINFKVAVQSKVVTKMDIHNDGNEITIKYMPGNDIETNLKIEIKNTNGTSITQTVFLRFKVDISVDNNQYYQLFKPKLTDEMKWTLGDDGYYYYNEFCFGDEMVEYNHEIDVCEYLEFVAEKDNNMLNGKTGDLCFIVEILEGNFDAIDDYWPTAPSLWRQNVN